MRPGGLVQPTAVGAAQAFGKPRQDRLEFGLGLGDPLHQSLVAPHLVGQRADLLAEVEEILQISARLVVNKAALKLDRERIRALIDALAAAVAASAKPAPKSRSRAA